MSYLVMSYFCYASCVHVELLEVKISKQPAAGEEEDSLDAFMNATVAQLRDDKGQKLQKRLQEIKRVFEDVQK